MKMTQEQLAELISKVFTNLGEKRKAVKKREKMYLQTFQLMKLLLRFLTLSETMVKTMKILKAKTLVKVTSNLTVLGFHLNLSQKLLPLLVSLKVKNLQLKSKMKKLLATVRAQSKIWKPKLQNQQLHNASTLICFLLTTVLRKQMISNLALMVCPLLSARKQPTECLVAL